MAESWWYLLIAIPFGVLGTVCLKLSSGLKKWKPTASLVLFYLISCAALTMAIQGIDVSIVYAIWSGVGTILIALIGIFIFEESISAKKIVSLLFVITGIIGIHLTNAIHQISI